MSCTDGENFVAFCHRQNITLIDGFTIFPFLDFKDRLEIANWKIKNQSGECWYSDRIELVRINYRKSSSILWHHLKSNLFAQTFILPDVVNFTSTTRSTRLFHRSQSRLLLDFQRDASIVPRHRNQAKFT